MSIASVTDERSARLLPVYLITVGVSHNQEPCRRPNGAPFHHIMYVEKGEGMFEVGGKKALLKEGSTVFIRKGTPSNYYAVGKPFQTGWITFDGAQIDSVLEYFFAEEFSSLQNDALHARIQSIYKLATRNTLPEELSTQVYDVIVSYFSMLETSKKQPVLLRAKKYVEEHFERDLSVADIADAVGISESLLFRLFRNEERSTPIDYLRRVRIRNAEQILLSAPHKKVSDICSQCGFSDSAYFCKVFKSETGMTPKIYRNRYAP
ncbi:MAG: AraC family transcriptional regulator [Clostridia bacterium]|nr:AraC family transcriptional regulator [Clostridia bacterium]